MGALVPRVPIVPAVLCFVLVIGGVRVANAQNPDRLPWFAFDLHAATIGLPQAEGWVPDLDTTTVYPGRNFGVMGAATVYPFRVGVMTFGIGASVSKASKSAETKVVSGSGATQTVVVTQVVRTGVTNLIPQISLNFGRKLGWSYISAGLGRTKVTSSADAIGSAAEIVVPEAWNSAINFGGGARWFMKPHLGASLDIRFVKLGSRSPTDVLPSAKRTQQWSISAGISIQ
jgi:hypothetical protein